MLQSTMIYILDAYNVIHKIPSLESALDKDLRSGRDALVALCSGWAGPRGDISKIILVFDGKSEFHGLPRTAPAKIKLVFSDTGEDADERIVKVLEQLGEKANKCVVSDDNFVRNQARAYKTRALSVTEFHRLLQPPVKRKNASLPKSNSKLSLSREAADKITQEYKKHLGL